MNVIMINAHKPMKVFFSNKMKVVQFRKLITSSVSLDVILILYRYKHQVETFQGNFYEKQRWVGDIG